MTADLAAGERIAVQDPSLAPFHNPTNSAAAAKEPTTAADSNGTTEARSYFTAMTSFLSVFSRAPVRGSEAGAKR